ncbi:hypothetical protein L218DRAFT_911022, partial [Marasmius fiardii PR-910]
MTFLFDLHSQVFFLIYHPAPSSHVLRTVHNMNSKVRAALADSDPWVVGTIPVPLGDLDLFYLDKCDPPCPQHLSLSNEAKLEDLQMLSTSCDDLNRGSISEEESYPGQMDPRCFAAKLDPHVMRRIVPQTIQTLYEAQDPRVEPKLHGLEIYETGSSSPAYQNTPLSSKHFASLVIVFPTPHVGGQLVLSCKGKEFTFDSGTILSRFGRSSDDTSTITFIAFSSVVKQEVLPVTSGHRITLTYNLYISDRLDPTCYLCPSSARVAMQ